MGNFMHRYGTPLTAGLFLVSTVSGVALFFHWAPRTFHAMHEWLSLLLLAPFALHLWKNWKPLLAYARRKTLLIPLLLCVIGAVPFALTAGKGRGGSPSSQTVALMTRASLAELAPMLGATPRVLLQQLQARGYKATSVDQTITAIAAASSVRATEVLYSMTAPASASDSKASGRN
ncbi:DUF4405 domain-containing protein [Frateuria sp. STR12]|uniref:DUF4405 domain-containing protein n=1 Tax=Frateuria hangzhouensis TaxID=2995589 RepID=UPI002260B4C9|nr:DUF4405 domain-containing protein [Frateuria sp. STR12]MCX7514650.1 DUF4405 domain-containing protein [Frateuria sp. STR12]